MNTDIKTDKNGYFYIDKRIGGKRCHLRATTKKALNEKIRAWIETFEEDETAKERGPLFDAVAAEWFEDVQTRVKIGTMACYAPRYKAILSHFAGRRISEITAADITEYFKVLKRQSYAYKTVSNTKIVLSQIWLYWIESPKWRGNANPVSLARIPKGLSREKRQPPTDEAIAKIKSAPDGIGVLANIILYTGVRLGEANAIQVKDIDFGRTVYGIKGCITINKSYMWRGNKPYLETPKTAAGYRIVPIFEPLRPILIEAIRGLSPDCFVASGCAEPLTKTQFSRRWETYCRNLGLAHPVKVPLRKDGKEYQRTEWKADITPHQFRHYLATMCFQAGIPEHTACVILGHSSADVTKKVYLHIREQMLTDSAQSLNELFTQELPNNQKLTLIG